MNKNDDTISRQDAIDAIHSYFKGELDAEPTKMMDGYEVCADMQSVNKKLHDNKMLSKAIKALPSARPKGKWIVKIDGIIFKREWGICSECGNTLDFSGVNAGRGDVNFCPNCGADMRGENDA